MILHDLYHVHHNKRLHDARLLSHIEVVKIRKERSAFEQLHKSNSLIDSSWWPVPFTSSQCAAIFSVLLDRGECRRASCCCSIPLHYLIHLRTLPPPTTTNPLSVVASWVSHYTQVKTKDLPAHQPPLFQHPQPALPSDSGLRHQPCYGFITHLKNVDPYFPPPWCLFTLPLQNRGPGPLEGGWGAGREGLKQIVTHFSRSP